MWQASWLSKLLLENSDFLHVSISMTLEALLNRPGTAHGYRFRQALPVPLEVVRINRDQTKGRLLHEAIGE